MPKPHQNPVGMPILPSGGPEAGWVQLRTCLIRVVLVLLLGGGSGALAAEPAPDGGDYDLVLAGGRVIDP